MSRLIPSTAGALVLCEVLAVAQSLIPEVGHLADRITFSGTNAYAPAADLGVSGNYLYVADSLDGVQIYDLSNPAAPQHVGYTTDTNYDLGWDASTLTISSNYLYVANSSDGLRVYDVSNPSAPISLGHAISTNQIARVVCTSKDYVYLLDGQAIEIYNASNPAAPQLVGTIEGDNIYRARRMSVSGQYLYLPVDSDGLYIYDISNPTNASQVALVLPDPDFGEPKDVAISGDYAYLASGWDGLRIYNISIPTNQVQVGYVDNHGGDSGSANAVSAAGEFVYLLNGQDGLRAYNVADPSNPINVGFRPQMAGPGARPVRTAVGGNYLYLANAQDGVRIYSLAPQINVGLSSTNTVVLSWYLLSNFADYRLEHTAGLRLPDWQQVAVTPSIVAGQHIVVLPLSGANQFYRLRSTGA